MVGQSFPKPVNDFRLVKGTQNGGLQDDTGSVFPEDDACLSEGPAARVAYIFGSS